MRAIWKEKKAFSDLDGVVIRVPAKMQCDLAIEVLEIGLFVGEACKEGCALSGIKSACEADSVGEENTGGTLSAGEEP